MKAIMSMNELKEIIKNDVVKMKQAFSLKEFVNHHHNRLFTVKAVGENFLINDEFLILNDFYDREDPRHWLTKEEKTISMKSVGFSIVKDNVVHCFDIVLNAKNTEIKDIVDIALPSNSILQGISGFCSCEDEKGILIRASENSFKEGFQESYNSGIATNFYFSH